jgi:ubiquinone/menaquinone biosynthesis C-methylase UbiE
MSSASASAPCQGSAPQGSEPQGSEPQGSEPQSSEPQSSEQPQPTRWDLDEVALGYEQWDNTICWVFGYPFVFRALGLGSAPLEAVLDLGCGPGIVAEHVARSYAVRVVGADASPAMVRLATDLHAHPLVECRLMHDCRLDFLDDACIDAALCCFVFITVPERDAITRLVGEAYRVLRPGGRFSVLEVHPASTGVRFAAFQVGEPGRSYRDGELKRTQLFVGDQAVDLVDVHWSEPVLTEALEGAGFVEVAREEPVLSDAVELADPATAGSVAWDQERTRPPFLILSGVKPV